MLNDLAFVFLGLAIWVAIHVVFLNRENEMLGSAQSDLQWCYDRLSHLSYIWNNPDSVQAGFGPKETLIALKDELPIIRTRNNLADCYAAEALATP